jgi:hypothetical protein
MQALRDQRQDFLVGNQLGWADTQLFEVTLMGEKCKPSVLPGFSLLQVTYTSSSQEGHVYSFILFPPSLPLFFPFFDTLPHFYTLLSITYF